MNENQLALLSPTEKAEFLRTNATNIKEGNYFRKYSPNELESKKDELVENCISIDHKEEEFADIKKAYSDEIKDMKKQRTSLTSAIKTKGQFEDGEIFEFADHDSGYMISFDIEGNEINKRRLRPDEKQANIFQLNKTA